MARENDPLLRYAKRPSRRRLGEVVRAYHAYVWRVALRICGNQEDAADVSQDVFLKLLLDPPAPGAIRSPGAYLAWRALGRARFLRRSRERQHIRERRFVEELAARELGRPAEPDVELLHHALDELSPDLRDAVELRYMAGLSPGQCAAALGISERALYGRLEKARGMLRRSLGPLALSTVFSVAGGASARSAPPPDLVPRLLEIANRGSSLSSLSAVAVPVALGGSLMVKKITVSVFLVTLVLLTAWWIAPSVEDPPLPERPVAVAEREDRAHPADRATVPPEDSVESVAGQEPLFTGPPRGVVKGRVVDVAGNPVPGARVECAQYMSAEKRARLVDLGYRDVPDETFRPAAWSGETGEFVVGNLLPGYAYVRGKKEGYFQGGSTKVVVVAGEEAWKEVELDLLKRLSGTLRGLDDLPLADGVVFFDLDTMHDAAVELGGRDAHARFTGVSGEVDGSYDTGYSLKVRRRVGLRVKAWARGHAMMQRFVEANEFRDLEARLDLELVPELPVTLRVRDVRGDAVEGAEVGLGDLDSVAGWFPYPAARTDERGLARVEHLERKENAILIVKEGYHPASVLVRPEESTDISVTLRPLGEAWIRTRVVFEGDAVYRRGSVEVSLLEQRDDGNWRSPPGVKSRTDGELEKLYWPAGPGRFRLVYRHHRDEFETEPFEYNGVERVDIDLPVPLDLQPPYVMGKVVSEGSGEPVPGALVQAHWFRAGAETSRWGRGIYVYVGERSFHFPGLPGRSEFQKADEEGRFLFFPRIEAGSTFVVNVRKRPEGISVPKGSRDVGWSQEVALDIDESAEITDVELVVERGAAIEGRVVDGEGEPAAGEHIALYDGRSLLEWTTSNGEGDFRFRALRAGSYAVEALGSSSDLGIGSRGASPDVAGLPSPEEFFAPRIQLASGETGNVTIDLGRDALGSIDGRIAAEVLPTVDRVRYGMIVGGRAREDVMTFGGEVRVNDGRFKIEGLFPGRYRVSTAGLLSAVEVDVARARSQAVLLDRPRGRLLLPVPLGEEEPVTDFRVVKVERFSHVLEDRTEHWEPLAGYQVQPAEGGWAIEGVLPGRVRALVIATGYPETWTEAVEVTEAGDVRVPPLQLEKVTERPERSDAR